MPLKVVSALRHATNAIRMEHTNKWQRSKCGGKQDAGSGLSARPAAGCRQHMQLTGTHTHTSSVVSVLCLWQLNWLFSVGALLTALRHVLVYPLGSGSPDHCAIALLMHVSSRKSHFANIINIASAAHITTGGQVTFPLTKAKA